MLSFQRSAIFAMRCRFRHNARAPLPHFIISKSLLGRDICLVDEFTYHGAHRIPPRCLITRQCYRFLIMTSRLRTACAPPQKLKLEICHLRRDECDTDGCVVHMYIYIYMSAEQVLARQRAKLITLFVRLSIDSAYEAKLHVLVFF